MKLTKLKIDNFMGVDCIEIEPDGSLVQVLGKNGAGKSSVLTGISVLFGGKKGAPNMPVKEGEEKAELVGETDEFRVIRTFKPDGKMGIKVESLDGKANYSSPQKFLDGFIGKLSFDPLEFSKMEEKKQRKVLLEMVGLAGNMEEIDAEIKASYDARTGINKQGQTLKAQIEGVAFPTEEECKDVDTAELFERLESTKANNEKSESMEEEKKELVGRINQFEQDLEDLEKKISERSILLGKDRYHLDNFPQVPCKIEVVEIEENLRNVSKKNRAAYSNRAVRDQHFADQKTLEGLRTQSKNLTGNIDKAEKKKTDMLSKAEFPINGLGFSENGITHNNIPFSQINDAEKLKTSLSVAMALNPNLKVITIGNGSLLDVDNFKVIEEMAEKEGFVLFVERVGVDALSFSGVK